MGILNIKENLKNTDPSVLLKSFKKYIPNCNLLSYDEDYIDWARLDKIFIMERKGDPTEYKLISIKKANESDTGYRVVYWSDLFKQDDIPHGMRLRTIKADTFLKYINTL